VQPTTTKPKIPVMADGQGVASYAGSRLLADLSDRADRGAGRHPAAELGACLASGAEPAGPPHVLVDAERADSAEPGRVIGTPLGLDLQGVPQLCQSTPSRRASALTVVSSSARASAAHTTARRVSISRGAASGRDSLNITTGQAGSGQCQTRLRQRTRTGGARTARRGARAHAGRAAP